MRNLIHQSNRLGNRERNEDRMATESRGETTLLLLADGLGNSGGGERAAQTFVDNLLFLFRKQILPVVDAKQFLSDAVQQAHKSIQHLDKIANEIPRTTAVACLIENDQATWVHAGDSRLYLIRQHQVLVRTQDHTYVEYLRSAGLLSEREVNAHPKRHYITSCLGSGKATAQLSLSEPQPLQTGDQILLCSDGVWSALEQNELLANLRQHPFASALDQITAQAEQRTWPNSDNASILGLHYLADNPHQNHVTPTTKPKTREPLDQAIAEIDLAYSLYDSELKSKK